MPPNPERCALAARILKEFLAANPEYVGDAFVCTHDEWVARGERYGKNSLATLVIDGSPLYDILGGYRTDKVQDRLNDVLDVAGLYLEPAMAWAYCVYEASPINRETA